MRGNSSTIYTAIVKRVWSNFSCKCFRFDERRIHGSEARNL